MEAKLSFVAVAVMEINAVIVCIVLALFALGSAAKAVYALKFLQKKCEPSDMDKDLIEVYTWRVKGRSVHLCKTCGGKGLRDTWRLPRWFLLNKKVVKVEWCGTCARQYIV